MYKILNILFIIMACLLEISYIGGSFVAAQKDKYKSLLIIIPQIIINICAIYFLAQNL